MTKEKSQRQLQVGEQIKRTLADVFMRENLSVINGSFVTILEADASPDIKNVRVFIDIFGNDANHKKILDKLNNAAPHFRHELGRRMTSRNTPEIKFILDRTQDKALKLESLIDQEAEAIAQVVIPAQKKPSRKKS